MRRPHSPPATDEHSKATLELHPPSEAGPVPFADPGLASLEALGRLDRACYAVNQLAEDLASLEQKVHLLQAATADLALRGLARGKVPHATT